MITKLFTKIIGSRNDRTVKALKKIVKQINELEPQFASLADVDLQAKTVEFRQRLEKGEELDSLLPEAFATVREASKRVFGMRHFDVQMMGGIVLNNNQIAEMKTGEGKTLTATLPAYLNALTGQGVHIVTVNDYLARRDAEWSRPLFAFLGMTVGCNLSGMSHEEKQAAYACDITYGTNNEFGFDYLRDNMAFAAEQRVQRPLYYALVDEVDSVLIDEARTPLIISGAAEDSSELYIKINTLVPLLQKQDKEDSEEYQGNGHYTVDEKARQAYLTENGQIFVEGWLKQQGLMGEDDSLFSVANITLLHHVNAALRANTLFERDVDYIVKDDEVIIVDEHTGRTMAGRRWSEGLHQAIEAKEGAKIRNENQTLASITFQNYFRLYEKLAGMTGTADTEAYEFQQIYGLETVVLPTNRPMIRDDMGDLVYLTEQEKYDAIIEDIKIRVAEQRPVLVGTISIENSELLSNILTKEGIEHKVLNAKFHAQEAQIVAQAGRPSAVTIATNMAGRGTDIVLGGSWQAEIDALENPTAEQIATIKSEWQVRHDAVIASGGLHIIGTERHESRRIDNQLRGRSGRQGDPGVSRFFLSLEDDLMRIFAGDRGVGMMRAMGLQENEAIEHKMVSRSIENAQRKVEARNFDIRKNLLKYDDVNNEQRKIIYSQRDEVLAESTLQDYIEGMHREVMKGVIENFIPPESIHDQWDIAGLEQALNADFGIDLPVNEWLENDRRLDEEALVERITDEVIARYRSRREQMGDESAAMLERNFMLSSLDRHWKDHLAAMDYLRQGIHLRGYAQKNPEQEYKKEAFNLFVNMLAIIKSDVVTDLSRVHVPTAEELAELEAQQQRQAESMRLSFEHDDVDGLTGEVTISEEPDRSLANAQFEVPESRNAPCPCGSGLKYKQCHGKI